MKDGKIYKDNLSLHIMIVEKYNLDVDEIREVGFIVKGDRTIWEKRKPD